ncbi:hypothetical protein [Streptomyces sp. N35]|uniref:hypothetical protein n=1 Tax=Streptomyces sp. N35 TaxID=2795730 RepID=UPI0018F51B03|nr:hypothetical protein [Streptomyces sp. N35]
MTRNDLANTPTEASIHTPLDNALIERLTSAVERLVAHSSSAELELKSFTPAEAARILGKTENWVVEAIQGRRIPFTYVGKSPRLTAAHIRLIQMQGEVLPHRYAAKSAA